MCIRDRSGGDPEDESLDPELIHDLGLYELHDESRDGDPLGARACPRASPRGGRCVRVALLGVLPF